MANIIDQQENCLSSQTVENVKTRNDMSQQQQQQQQLEGSNEERRNRDEKLKIARERQNEERQRKIEELKAQAEASQRYREQKEEERRRRIDEMRQRDLEKRHQVEERKRAIMEAERERREYILRKNQERESRLVTKRRDRNSMSFAFGSSTPRLLEPADFGVVSSSTFWSQRRSTSITNVSNSSLTRRSVERELPDSATKKRAISATGTERRDEDQIDTSLMVFRSVARRKTDLMPTIPSPRDGHYGSRGSLSTTPRTPGSRSGNATPGGHLNSSRSGSSLSNSPMTASGYVPRKSAPAQRKPRPVSIAGTGVSLEELNKLKREPKPPLKISGLATPSPTLSAQTTPRRTPNLMSTSMYVTPSTRLSSAERKTTSKREITTPKTAASTPKALVKTTSSERLKRVPSEKKPKDSLSMTRSMVVPSTASIAIDTETSQPAEKPKTAITQQVAAQVVQEVTDNKTQPTVETPAQTIREVKKASSGRSSRSNSNSSKASLDAQQDNLTTSLRVEESGNDSMTASMMAKKITTEEEAKAALAERRRKAREEAERQAEIKRQQEEEEQLAEIKRQEEEAERQRQFEEEAERLAAERRQAEEERLRKAIEEATQREEEERRKREEEEKQRIEREALEKKSKEEAEKQRLEVAEKLKREEKEREERRKRVEAIMSRTRKGNSSTPNSPATVAKEMNESAKQNETLEIQADSTASDIGNTSSSSPSTSGSSSTQETSPTTAIEKTPQPAVDNAVENEHEPQNTQAMYEQSVSDKENLLMSSFSSLLIGDNAKNTVHSNDVTNGKLTTDFLLNATNNTVTNGNGHVENTNNENETKLLQDIVTSSADTNQLIDLSIESQQGLAHPLNFTNSNNNTNNNNNNNNSLLTNSTSAVANTATTATALVTTGESHENAAGVSY